MRDPVRVRAKRASRSRSNPRGVSQKSPTRRGAGKDAQNTCGCACRNGSMFVFPDSPEVVSTEDEPWAFRAFASMPDAQPSAVGDETSSSSPIATAACVDGSGAPLKYENMLDHMSGGFAACDAGNVAELGYSDFGENSCDVCTLPTRRQLTRFPPKSDMAHNALPDCFDMSSALPPNSQESIITKSPGDWDSSSVVPEDCTFSIKDAGLVEELLTGTSQTSGGQATTFTISEPASTPAPRTRSRDESVSGEESDIEDGHSVKSNKKPSTTQTTERLFACPFYKRDPVKHHPCATKVLKRPKDVKQHLKRLHQTPAFYCARCYKIFDNSVGRDDHTRNNSCPIQRNHQFEGVTNDQCKRLEKYTGRSKSPEEQWYIIWEIVFPKVSRPKSPFQESYQLEVLNMVEDLWRQKRAEIVQGVLDSKGFAIDEQFEAHITASMGSIFARLKNEARCFELHPKKEKGTDCLELSLSIETTSSHSGYTYDAMMDQPAISRAFTEEPSEICGDIWNEPGNFIDLLTPPTPLSDLMQDQMILDSD